MIPYRIEGCSAAQLMDIINIWYFKHYNHKLLWKHLNTPVEKIKLIFRLVPKTDNLDEFFQQINPLLKKAIGE